MVRNGLICYKMGESAHLRSKQLGLPYVKYLVSLVANFAAFGRHSLLWSEVTTFKKSQRVYLWILGTIACSGLAGATIKMSQVANTLAPLSLAVGAGRHVVGGGREANIPQLRITMDYCNRIPTR